MPTDDPPQGPRGAAKASPQKPSCESKSGTAKPSAKRKAPADAPPKLKRKSRARKLRPQAPAIGPEPETLAFALESQSIEFAPLEPAAVEPEAALSTQELIEILTAPEPVQLEPSPATPDEEGCAAAEESIETTLLFKSIEAAEAVAVCAPESPVDEIAPMAPLAPIRLKRTPPAPKPIGYLDRARLAAQAQSEVLLRSEDRGFLARLGDYRGLLISVGASAAALLTAGLLVAGSDKPAAEAEGVSVSVAEAKAATQEAASGAAAAEYYAEAQRLITAGRSAQGLSLLERAAAGGLAPAQYELSKRYEAGDGVSRNLSLALSWAERAARGGEVRAMHDVGVYYARGEGAPLDEAAAFRWFRQAAIRGVPDSQYNLGVLYEQGRGVAAEPEEALFWYLVAARNQDDDAIDRAVALASTLSTDTVARIQGRARAFEASSSQRAELAP